VQLFFRFDSGVDSVYDDEDGEQVSINVCPQCNCKNYDQTWQQHALNDVEVSNQVYMAAYSFFLEPPWIRHWRYLPIEDSFEISLFLIVSCDMQDSFQEGLLLSDNI